MVTNRGGWPMRLTGLVRKNYLQVIRDPSSLAIAFVLPAILLLLSGYGVSLDSEHVPIAIVVDKPTADTSSLCAELEHSVYFDTVYIHGMAAAKQAMMERRVDAILHLRENFLTAQAGRQSIGATGRHECLVVSGSSDRQSGDAVCRYRAVCACCDRRRTDDLCDFGDAATGNAGRVFVSGAGHYSVRILN